MLLYIWFAVMVQAFAPGGERLMLQQLNAIESHLLAGIERAPTAAPTRPTPTQRARTRAPAGAMAR